MSKQMEALLERARIEENKQFRRLSEKTQVVSPKNGMKEVPTNRQSHSQEVATSSKIIAASLSETHGKSLKEIDYKTSVENVSLIHDIGHPAFGHDGSDIINQIMISKGLKEGFSDNNNNLVVISKNKIALRDYVIASSIKYPDELYEYQKKIYLPMLERANKEDFDHYNDCGIKINIQKRTIACQIMDESDRNSYVCSDLSDFISMGNSLSPQKVKRISLPYELGLSERKILDEVIEVAKFGNKSDTKRFFGDLKQRFNFNHIIRPDGLDFLDKGLLNLRECLNKVSLECYIVPIRKMENHHDNMRKMIAFVNHIIDNNHYPSGHYRNLIEGSTSEEDKLRAIRDMISEVSDWYVLVECDRLNLIPENEQIYKSSYGY